MITNNRIPANIILVSIVTITIFGSGVAIPYYKFCRIGDRKASTSKQKENPNRLINESSPYLLQHATNPVDWYPWNEEAFEQQKEKTSRFFCPSDIPPATGAT